MPQQRVIEPAPMKEVKKNKYGGNEKSRAETENGATKKGPLYYGSKQRKELLCL